MTQLKTQLTKSVLSLPFIQKSKSIHLLHLCGRLRLITHDLKHLWSLARVYTPGTSLSMPILLLWLELQLFPPHLNFTLISTYPCEFSSQSPDFSDPTFKNLLDQQSTRVTLSSVLYTSEILLLHSTRSQSKFGLHSLVLQPCPVQCEQQQLHHRLLLWWALQDKGPPKHLKITIHYGEKGKSHALLSLGPLLSWKP